ncbi:hypothetical protein [Microbacterium aerolatum]|uniref:hypothetical protein n=1 Tax=Microbacterium aerolatum TaxID=153731 RepID=UPI00384B7D01
MVMFSSRPPFNDDPKPWRCTSCSDRFVREQVSPTSHVTKHQPRTKFDRPQHNPTNLILAEFRSIEAEGVWKDVPRWASAGAWVDMIDEDPSMSRGEDWGLLAGLPHYAEIDHARRVLERLARLP